MKDDPGAYPTGENNLAPGFHACFFGNRIKTDFPLLLQALEQNWQVLLFSDSSAQRNMFQIDPNRGKLGQIRIFPLPIWERNKDQFRRAWEICWQEAEYQMESNGYRGVFGLIDLAGMVGDEDDLADPIAIYEEKVDFVTKDLPIAVLCCYDRQFFIPEILLLALQIHPLFISNDQPVQNFYYFPPQYQFEPVKQLDWCLDRLEVYRKQTVLEQLLEQYNRQLEQAYRRINHVETNLRAIYDSSREIIMIFDSDSRLVAYNRTARDVMQNVMRTAIREGQSITEILPPFLAEPTQSIFRRVLEGEQIQQEQKYLAPGGEVLWFEFNYFLIQPLPQGEKQIGVSGIDITERKRLDDAEKAAQEFAEILTQTLLDMTIDENLDEMLGRLLQYFRRVIAYDQALLLFVEGSQAKVIAGRGFSAPAGIIGKTVPADSSLFQFAAQNQPWLLVADALVDERFAPFYHEIWARSWMIIPLMTQHTLIGYLMAGERQAGELSQNQAKLAYAFASEAALAIENARLFQQLHQLAITDSLTGAYTRRSLFEVAELELERAHRYRHPLSTILLDIDFFKQVNDTYGHITGDAVLVKLVEVIRTEMRRNDILGRYGGEEFILLLPETTSNKAFEAAERIRLKVAHTELDIDGKIISITISLGVASCEPPCNYVDELFNRADKAMYAAKNAGRNRTIVWNTELDKDFSGYSPLAIR